MIIVGSAFFCYQLDRIGLYPQWVRPARFFYLYYLKIIWTKTIYIYIYYIYIWLYIYLFMYIIVYITYIYIYECSFWMFLVISSVSNRAWIIPARRRRSAPPAHRFRRNGSGTTAAPRRCRRGSEQRWTGSVNIPRCRGWPWWPWWGHGDRVLPSGKQTGSYWKWP